MFSYFQLIVRELSGDWMRYYAKGTSTTTQKCVSTPDIACEDSNAQGTRGPECTDSMSSPFISQHIYIYMNIPIYTCIYIYVCIYTYIHAFTSAVLLHESASSGCVIPCGSVTFT
jgi:hypothetical protein